MNRKSYRRDRESAARRITRYELTDWSFAPEALMQLNRLRALLHCPLMNAIEYVVKTLRQDIENFEIVGTNPQGRIQGLRRISNSNYETERKRLRRDGYYMFPFKVLNSSPNNPTVYALLRLEGLRKRFPYSPRI